MSPPLVPPLPVLVDENVWPEFAPAIRALGPDWTAPSGRSYRLELSGRRLEVFLRLAAEPAAAPGGDEIDADLFELACAVQDEVGGEWSGETLRRAAAVWGGYRPR